jgi:VanZ family protein
LSTGSDRLKHFLLYQGPALGFAAVIIFMSSLPGSAIPTMPFLNGDKLVHCLEFGLFGMLLFRAFRFPPLTHNPYRLTVVVGMLFAASDELHQLFVPGRYCDILDFIADSLGIIVFAWISSRQHPLPAPPKTPGKPEAHSPI